MEKFNSNIQLLEKYIDNTGLEFIPMKGPNNQERTSTESISVEIDDDPASTKGNTGVSLTLNNPVVISLSKVAVTYETDSASDLLRSLSIDAVSDDLTESVNALPAHVKGIVFKNIDFQLNQGVIAALVGESVSWIVSCFRHASLFFLQGCGKSTLMKVCLGN